MIIRLSDVISYLSHLDDLRNNPMMSALLYFAVTDLTEQEHDFPWDESDVNRVVKYAHTFGVTHNVPGLPSKPLAKWNVRDIHSALRVIPAVAPPAAPPTPPPAPSTRPRSHEKPPGYTDHPELGQAQPRQPGAQTHLTRALDHQAMMESTLGVVRPGTKDLPAEDDRPGYLKALRGDF